MSYHYMGVTGKPTVIERIPLTPEMIEEYIDKQIHHWRNKYMSSAMNGNQYGTARCGSYIDAFQGMRIALLGKHLSETT